MGQLIRSSYQPQWWLRSPNLQTIWPSLFRPSADFIPDWERAELDDGDFMDLAWYRRPEADAPLIMLIHGLEGSIESHYASNMMAALYQAGYSTVIWHLRGRGREPNRLPYSYHSGASDDLRMILEYLQRQAQLPRAVVAVSLGANLMLKYLGEEREHSLIQTAVAISVPFQLKACALKLHQGFAKVYGQYLLKTLKASYCEKFSRLAAPLTIDLDQINTLRAFDEAFTAPVNGFASADDYYQRCSCTQFLHAINTPTLILHARDDPFMTPQVIPTVQQMSDAITLELSEHGGHVGFINQGYSGLSYWLEQRVVEHLWQQIPVNLERENHVNPELNSEFT